MNRINDFRTQEKITLRELSERTGLSVGYLCHLEKGTRTNPSYNTMVKISKVLNKTVAEVFNI